MRKVFISILVLGLSALANAGLSFRVNGTPVPNGGTSYCYASDISIIQIMNDETVTGPIDIGWIAFIPDWFQTVAPPVAYNENLSGEWDIVEYGWDSGYFFFDTTNILPAVADTLAGPLFEITLHCTGVGQTPIEIWNERYDTLLASMTLSESPEPASLTLLAAGGLLLRRRGIS